MAHKCQRRPWEGAAAWESKRLEKSSDAPILARRPHSFNTQEVSRG